jgi:hypothetical protein
MGLLDFLCDVADGACNVGDYVFNHQEDLDIRAIHNYRVERGLSDGQIERDKRYDMRVYKMYGARYVVEGKGRNLGVREW